MMNAGETEHLQNDNEFNIIMTAAPDEKVLNQFLEHLVNDSVATHDAQIEQISHLTF